MNHALLGRYTEAKETASQAERERAAALYELKALIHSESAPEEPKRIDWAKARALLEAAAAADGTLQAAFEAANVAAETLGRPRLTYRG